MTFKIYTQATEGAQPIYMASGPTADALALLAAINSFITTEIRAVGSDLKPVIKLSIVPPINAAPIEPTESKGRMPGLELPIAPLINADPIATSLGKVAIEEVEYDPYSEGDSPGYEGVQPPQPTMLEVVSGVLATNSKEEAARIIEVMLENAKAAQPILQLEERAKEEILVLQSEEDYLKDASAKLGSTLNPFRRALAIVVEWMFGDALHENPELNKNRNCNIYSAKHPEGPILATSHGVAIGNGGPYIRALKQSVPLNALKVLDTNHHYFHYYTDEQNSVQAYYQLQAPKSTMPPKNAVWSAKHLREHETMPYTDYHIDSVYFELPSVLLCPAHLAQTEENMRPIPERRISVHAAAEQCLTLAQSTPEIRECIEKFLRPSAAPKQEIGDNIRQPGRGFSASRGRSHSSGRGRSHSSGRGQPPRHQRSLQSQVSQPNKRHRGGHSRSPPGRGERGREQGRGSR
jgi:hypothetical protein